MLTAVIIIALVAAIVVLARRWPDVEAKLWPDEVDVPAKEAGAPSDAADSDSASGDIFDKTTVTETPVERTAGGLMRKKTLTTEPDVDSIPEAKEPTFMDQEETNVKSAPTPPAFRVDETAEPITPTNDATQDTPEPTRAAPKQKPTGPRVMGEPARPSQPAYVDATKRHTESFEQLSTEADRAWQERQYEKAEQACLKILVQQPKNHKYMTRIGQIYQEKGELEDAKEAFEAAKKLDPKNFFVLNRLSEVERMITDKGGRTSFKKPVAAGKK